MTPRGHILGKGENNSEFKSLAILSKSIYCEAMKHGLQVYQRYFQVFFMSLTSNILCLFYPEKAETSQNIFFPPFSRKKVSVTMKLTLQEYQW